MTMTIDTHNQHRFGSLNFDHMSSYSSHPHFTNPWVSTSAPAGPGPQGLACSEDRQGGSQSLYVSSQDGNSLPHLNLSGLSKHPQHSSRPGGSTSMAPYASLPVSAASAGDVYSRQHGLMPMSQDLLSINRLQHPTTSAPPYDTSAYTTSASPVTASYATSPTPYDQLGYAPAPMRGTYAALASEDSSRRYSQQSVASSLMSLHSSGGHEGQYQTTSESDYDFRGLQPDDRRSFQDALEASHGMMSLSQDTPRNIYDVRARQRGSTESYGFPSTHSTTSSVSSTGFSPYYGGSVDGSVSDYSTTGSDIESLSGRALPRPQGLMTGQPPAPQSMMGSFSSKVSSSTQKKHKCKVCDKRFTRPSSLQTHMYSHTGEKPFQCEVEGCGRNFSVVSNLRRHRKVHKNQGEPQTPSETGSEDHQSDE